MNRMKISESHRLGLAKIDPRPRTIYCSQGRVVLATDLDGFINENPLHGLFVGETRMLSHYRHLVQGKPPQVVVVSNVEQHSYLGYYVTLPRGLKGKPDSGSGAMQPVSEATIELKVSRTVGLGVHEDIDFTNFTQQPVRFSFEIELDADFADQAETGRRKQHGRLHQRWRRLSQSIAELRLDYHAEHRYSHQGNRGTARLECGLTVSIENSGSPASYRDGKLHFTVPLNPGGSWHACVKLIPLFEGNKLLPMYGCREFFGTHNELDRRRRIFLTESARFESLAEPTLAPTVTAALNQAKIDLADLRLPDLDLNERSWVPAAGLPIYIALFGRDTLTTGWQAALASTAVMHGALYELPKWQGKVENDWRDEQPGRMLHEAHTGPLAKLNYNPRSRYYGAATTSGFYPVVLSELWHWTGDKSIIEPLIKPALEGLKWKDKYTDRFGDGFYDYQSRSSQGNRNQGWKDSGDAIVYEDGRQVEPPI
jgi:glycogen debranching enzyme